MIPFDWQEMINETLCMFEDLTHEEREIIFRFVEILKKDAEKAERINNKFHQMVKMVKTLPPKRQSTDNGGV